MKKLLISKIIFLNLLVLVFTAGQLLAEGKAKAMKVKALATTKLANKYIEAYVADTGKFTIGTVEGDPARTSDNNKALIYGHGSPGTSDTMVRIDGSERNYASGTPVTPPTLSGESILCAWDHNNIVRVTQILSIVKSKGTRSRDTIEIKYIVSNRDSSPHDIGLRIQLDTLLGTNDGAPFRVIDFGEVTTDREWDNNPATTNIPDIPQYSHVFDSLSNPTVFSMITLKDIGYRTPDRLVLGYWPVSVGAWDYTIDPNRSFLDNNLDGTISGNSPDSDSSAIVWWGYPGQAITLNPGQSVDLAILYGLSSLSFYPWSPFNIGLTSPGELEVTTDVTTFKYLPAPFIITAYMENVTNNAVNDATITLNLPTEFSLDTGEQLTKYIEEVPGTRAVSAKKSAQVSWRVNTYGRYIGDRLFSVTVNANSASKTAQRSIYVPGIGYDIFGQVTDKSGNPVSGATVQALNAGNVIATTNTEPDGTYIFRTLLPGDYEVITSANGYSNVTSPAPVTSESPSTNPVLLSASASAFESFAYPNPAREGDVKIRWYCDSTKNITIKIFNSSGGLIKKYSSNTDAGSWKEISWNIDDVANGVYFYRIEGAGIDKTGKIAVLKKSSLR